MAELRDDVKVNIEHQVGGLENVQKSIDAHRELGAGTAELQAEFDDLKQTTDTLNLQSSLVDKMQAGEVALAAATAKAAEFTEQQQALKVGVEAAAAAQAQASTAYDAATQRVNELDLQLKRHQETIANLKAEQDKNRTALQNARDQYGANSAEVQKLTARDRELAEAISAERAQQASANTSRTEARQTAAGLKDALSDQNAALRDAEKALAAQSKETDKAGAAAAKLQGEVQAMRDELQAGGIDTANLAGEQQRLQQELEHAAGAADQFGQRVDESLEKAHQASRRSLISIGAVASAIGNLAAQAVNFAKDSVVNFVRSLTDGFGENEKFERSMKRTADTAVELQRNLDEVAAVSDELGIIDDDLAEAFVTLKNAGLDPAAGALRDVATVAKALGGEKERLTKLTEIYAEATLKGVVNIETLNKANKEQVPLLEALAKSLALSTDEVLKLAQSGKLTAEDLRKAFALMARDMAGAAKELDDSWTGATQRADKALDDFTDAATNSGLQAKVIEIFKGIGIASSESADMVRDSGVRVGGVLQAILGPLDAVAGSVRLVFNTLTILGNAAVGGLATAWSTVLRIVDETPVLGATLRALGADVGAVADNLQAVADGALERVRRDGEDAQAALVQIGRGMTTTATGVRDAFVGLEGAAESTADSAEAAGDALLKHLAPGAQEAARALQSAAEKGADASKAVADLTSKVDTSSPQALLNLVDGLQAVASQSKLTAEEIDKGITAGLEKISTEKLPELLESAQAALGQIDQSAAGGAAKFEQMSGIVERIRTEGFARLGVDTQAVLSGIDAKAKALLETFRQLVSDPQANPKLLTAAYRSLLDQLDSPQELEALKGSLRGVQIAGFDGAKAIAEIEKKIKDVAAAADPMRKAVQSAFETLNVSSSASLAAIATKAEEAYATIRESGIATAVDLDRAFAAYSEAVINAAAAQGDAAVAAAERSLRAAAATDQQRQAVQQLTTQYSEKGRAAEQAGTAAAAGSQRASAALEDELSNLTAVEQAYLRRTAARDSERDPRAASPSTDGGVASASAIDPRYMQLNADQRAEVDALFNELYSGHISETRRLGHSNTSVRGRLTTDVSDLITRLLEGSAQPQAGRTIQIDINLPGIGRARVYATPDQAELLQDMLQELERELSVYGGS